jgi:NADH:ubiquinone oxidoreductase subunit 3 (subunit A)
MVIFIAIALTIILLIIIKATQKTERSSNEKATQFECGFNTMSPSHIPFSFQFFLVAILFLIFDVEIRMVLSYPLERKASINTNVILVFLLTLLIGLIYE